MKSKEFRAGALRLSSRRTRVENEMAAVRLMRSSGVSEIDEVLASVARQLAAELGRSQSPDAGMPACRLCGDPGVLEEKAPAVVRIISHRRVSAL